MIRIKRKRAAEPRTYRVDRKVMAETIEDFMALTPEGAAKYVEGERRIYRSEARREAWSLLLTFFLFALNAVYGVMHYVTEGDNWTWFYVGIAAFFGWQTRRDAARSIAADEHRATLIDTFEYMLEQRRQLDSRSGK